MCVLESIRGLKGLRRGKDSYKFGLVDAIKGGGEVMKELGDFVIQGFHTIWVREDCRELRF